MVHMIGGPSFGGYSAYRNHTIAREGQWRMPRNYGRGSTRISIRNYCGCNRGGYSGFQMPAWMMWMNFGLGWANQLLGMFTPTPKPAAPAAPEAKKETKTTDETNPLQQRIDELEAEIKKLKEDKKENTVNTNPVMSNPEDDKKKDLTASVNLNTEEVVENETNPPEELTTKVTVKKGKRQADGSVIYQGWKTLAASYGVENTKEFRNWFRKEHLGGKDIWQIGEQNFPNTIEYKGTKYNFNSTTFDTPIDKHDGTSGSVTTANMAAKTKPGSTVEKRSWKGTATATWTDADGKKHTATASRSGFEKPEDLKDALKAEIAQKVPPGATIKYSSEQE